MTESVVLAGSEETVQATLDRLSRWQGYARAEHSWYTQLLRRSGSETPSDLTALYQAQQSRWSRRLVELSRQKDQIEQTARMASARDAAVRRAADLVAEIAAEIAAEPVRVGAAAEVDVVRQPLEVEAREEVHHQVRLVAEREDELRRDVIRAGVVVVALGGIAGIITLILSETGSGKPDRGAGFRAHAAELRGTADDGLPLNASQTWWGWSGAAADGYAGRVRGQRARVAEVAEVDRQVADLLTVQADHVEQARQALWAALIALGLGIGVAVGLEERWRAEVAVGSPAAPAWEEVLVMVGTCVALAAIAAGVWALHALDNAGIRTEKALVSVIDSYRGVVNQAQFHTD